MPWHSINIHSTTTVMIHTQHKNLYKFVYKKRHEASSTQFAKSSTRSFLKVSHFSSTLVRHMALHYLLIYSYLNYKGVNIESNPCCEPPGKVLRRRGQHELSKGTVNDYPLFSFSYRVIRVAFGNGSLHSTNIK